MPRRDVHGLDPTPGAERRPERLALVHDRARAGGMQFLRWAEPADWSVEVLLPDGPTRERALALHTDAIFSYAGGRTDAAIGLAEEALAVLGETSHSTVRTTLPSSPRITRP